MVSLIDIQDAHEKLLENKAAWVTPLIIEPRLSRELGCELYLKLENLQQTGSYKVRGAFNMIRQLPSNVPGLVTASAGNHAQGVGSAVKKLGLAERTTVFMPKNAPLVKVERTRSFGVSVELKGGTYGEAKVFASEWAKKQDPPHTEIPAFDHEHVIAGQGTVGLEVAEVGRKIGVHFDHVIVPVGGGGLLAGVASVFAHLGSQPRGGKTEVIGIQASETPALKAAYNAGMPVKIAPPNYPILADGINVQEIGAETFKTIRSLMPSNGHFTVRNKVVGIAIGWLWDLLRMKVEGAGAIGIAALLDIDWLRRHVRGKSVVVVISGGNIDQDRFDDLMSDQESRIRRLGLMP